MGLSEAEPDGGFGLESLAIKIPSHALHLLLELGIQKVRETAIAILAASFFNKLLHLLREAFALLHHLRDLHGAEPCVDRIPRVGAIPEYDLDAGKPVVLVANEEGVLVPVEDRHGAAATLVYRIPEVLCDVDLGDTLTALVNDAGRLEEDALPLRNRLGGEDGAGLEVLGEEDDSSLAVQVRHMNTADADVVDEQVGDDQHDHQEHDAPAVLDQLHHQSPDEEADQAHRSLLAGLLRVQLGKVVVLGEVNTQRGLARPRRDTAQSTQSLADAQSKHLAPWSQGGAVEFQEEGRIVEDVREKTVPLRLGLDAETPAIGKDNSRDPGHGVREDSQQQSIRGRGISISDPEALE